MEGFLNISQPCSSSSCCSAYSSSVVIFPAIAFSGVSLYTCIIKRTLCRFLCSDYSSSVLCPTDSDCLSIPKIQLSFQLSKISCALLGIFPLGHLLQAERKANRRLPLLSVITVLLCLLSQCLKELFNIFYLVF